MFLKNTMKKIKITKNKFAIVDDEDYEKVSKNKWSYSSNGYVVRGKPQISLHRFVMHAKKGQQIDHKNRNKLDNRKENLRFCNTKQNHWNDISKTGVHFRPNRNSWIVRMMINGKRKYIGYFANKKLALDARKQASLKYYKEFSPYA